MIVSFMCERENCSERGHELFSFILSPVVSSALSPAPRDTAYPPSPGNASCSPRPAAGEWSTEKTQNTPDHHTHSDWKTRAFMCKHARTLLSSFWYWGIFFSIWDRSLIVVCWNTRKGKVHNNYLPKVLLKKLPWCWTFGLTFPAINTNMKWNSLMCVCAFFTFKALL